ncbi:MAG TPA: 50S ribosomal protein L25 [Deltaproteobacteria bacterium]|nr:50S ribosomal protein L25 [Deltaproteobacteria bacterium]
MDTTIRATPREQSGKGWARKTRAEGLLPAVVYGPGFGPRPICLSPVELLGLFKETGNRNTIVDLQIAEDAAVPCLVREVQRHPVSRKLLHVDFYAVDREGEVEVMIPLRPVGRPKGAILGGRLRLIRREIRASCRYDRIPESFEVDVSPMDIGDMIKASEIPLPEGVSLASDHDYNIISVYGKRRSADKKK